ncbi:GNAT family N-acetyltransferase [Alteromonas sp. ASW11-130]|uniref:GNAT family N-acetyltransferase n=1 Tax=Alteromonas sp. ASW11-130 TaxID=3015775 RepID=UPI002241A77A|nr:GNAT family N-acetyltransferase [Alteromonas sp. ASW11-130]MCW8091271.1 GNAT family N-acetyltransferase [Alteromonas sp. ASW11-130]
MAAHPCLVSEPDRAIRREPTPLMSKLQTKIHLGHSAFAELEHHWLKLQEQENTLPFIHFHWCVKQASYVAQPIILSIWDQEECVAILPLAKKVVIHKMRIEGLVHLCQRFTDYQSLLGSSRFLLSDYLDAAFSALSYSAFKSLPVFLHNPDHHLTSVVVSSAKRFGTIKKFNRWEHVSYAEKLGPIKKKVIGDASRRRRKLEEKGNFVTSLDSGYDRTLVGWILNKNADRHGEGALTNYNDRDDIQKLLKDCGNTLHIASIKLDEQIVAAHLGFKVNECLYYFVPVINPDFRQYSPGMILLEQIFTHFKELKINKVDFLRGDEAYKYKWGNKKQKKFGLCCLPKKISPIKKLILLWWFKRNQ